MAKAIAITITIFFIVSVLSLFFVAPTAGASRGAVNATVGAFVPSRSRAQDSRGRVKLLCRGKRKFVKEV
ncbi:MAG: hypothetical protein NTV49_12665 [Kiritimatiellaeota bacterium]|nr:hypothetical protein [Kiritimatiellota bacterium]